MSNVVSLAAVRAALPVEREIGILEMSSMFEEMLKTVVQEACIDFDNDDDSGTSAQAFLDRCVAIIEQVRNGQ
jgi:hypothetical protein